MKALFFSGLLAFLIMLKVTISSCCMESTKCEACTVLIGCTFIQEINGKVSCVRIGEVLAYRVKKTATTPDRCSRITGKVASRTSVASTNATGQGPQLETQLPRPPALPTPPFPTPTPSTVSPSTHPSQIPRFSAMPTPPSPSPTLSTLQSRPTSIVTTRLVPVTTPPSPSSPSLFTSKLLLSVPPLQTPVPPLQTPVPQRIFSRTLPTPPSSSSTLPSVPNIKTTTTAASSSPQSTVNVLTQKPLTAVFTSKHEENSTVTTLQPIKSVPVQPTIIPLTPKPTDAQTTTNSSSSSVPQYPRTPFPSPVVEIIRPRVSTSDFESPITVDFGYKCYFKNGKLVENENDKLERVLCKAYKTTHKFVMKYENIPLRDWNNYNPMARRQMRCRFLLKHFQACKKKENHFVLKRVHGI